jgi:cellulose synthase/poly-beta-1,6-N-acetylglucosamine synthase-like glycosyltransferase
VIAIAVFWTCLGTVLYIYVGYPLTIMLLSLVHRRDVRKGSTVPDLTIVIAAFNEEAVIERTILNKLSQDYPTNKLSVVVVSDASTDRTDEIVQRLAEANGGRVRLLRQEPRQGKTQALNLAVSSISTAIVVFSDANSMYSPNAISTLVRSFADQDVGYVTGNMVYTNPAGTSVGEGSGQYMSYENLLRRLEMRVGSIVGVDGGIDAIRRDLFVPMRPDQLPDFVLPLKVVAQGKRVVYEPDARVYESTLSDAQGEFRMRVRVALRALWALFDERAMLNPFRHGFFSWQLLWHKMFRYAAFVPLIGLAISNAILISESDFYAVFMALQATVYGLSGLGHIFSASRASPSYLLLPYYFVLLNIACVVAFWKFANGQRVIVWTPRGGG